MTNIYNFLPARSNSRFTTFLVLVNYALTTKQTELIITQIKKLHERLQEWGASKEQSRDLYTAVRKVHLENGNRCFAAPAFLCPSSRSAVLRIRLLPRLPPPLSALRTWQGVG